MIRAIHNTSDGTGKHATAGLLNIGYRSGLASRIEQFLLAEGAVVLRTRVPVSPQLLTFARLGAFVIIESDEPTSITFTRADLTNAKPIELASELVHAGPDQILGEIHRLASIPTGEDDNDNGLGI